MSVVLQPTLWGAKDPPAITLFKRAGFNVHWDSRGPPASSFDIRQQGLANGTTDCILASAEALGKNLATGVSLAAVLPRQSAHLGLVAALGTLHPTPANPVGLDPRATIAVGSLGQQSQLLALCPNLDIVQPDCPVSALQQHALDAIVIPMHQIEGADLENLDLIELREEIMLPPPGAGTMVLVARTGDPLGKTLKSLDDPKTRRCLSAERSLADALGRPAGLACLATQGVDGSIRLQATLAGTASDPRSALVRIGAVATTPEAAAELCRLALEECLDQTSSKS